MEPETENMISNVIWRTVSRLVDEIIPSDHLWYDLINSTWYSTPDHVTIIIICIYSHSADIVSNYSKTCVKRPLSKRQKMVFKTDYRIMQVKVIAECYPLENPAILSTFINLPFAIKTFVLFILSGCFTQGLLY